MTNPEIIIIGGGVSESMQTVIGLINGQVAPLTSIPAEVEKNIKLNGILTDINKGYQYQQKFILKWY
ncbi:MAG: hypothetical protein ACM3X9_11525 [Bacillota bacterium]